MIARSAHSRSLSVVAQPSESKVHSFFTSRLTIAFLAIVLTISLNKLSSLTYPRVTEISIIDISNVHATPFGHKSQQKLLILTPLKDAENYVDEYFQNLQRLNYPPSLISIAFLISDSTDQTLARLTSRVNSLSKLPPSQRYNSISIFQKDFHFNLSGNTRHGFEGQPLRRAFIARARNFLLSSALKWDHSWVLWLDVDVVRYDPDILMDLMKVDKDIVVPNTLWHMNKEKKWDFWGFDRNNFAETEESLALIAKLGPDVLLVEGYKELATNRLHLVDMPTHLGLAHVPLDGIGCTFALVKAHVHKEGVMFPTFVFENQIETEGLAKMAKKAGFEVVGIPGLMVFHAQNH